MAECIIVYWRDIPAQVIVRSGRRSAKREAPEAFAKAIDQAAMASGARDSESYLQSWRRDAPIRCGDDLEAEADCALSVLVSAYDAARLRRLVENGGLERG